MSNLYKEYNRMILANFNIEQIEQLIFLYSFFSKKNQIFRYEQFIGEISNKYSARYLEQLIKCITHDTPYQLFLNKNLSISVINELRRYLEDSINGNELNDDNNKLFYIIAEVMIKKKWSSNLIYQFRRFIKCNKPISAVEAKELLDFINNNKLYDWGILNILYDLYINTSFCYLKEVMISDYFENWIFLYSVVNVLEKRYLLLIEFREYVDKLIEVRFLNDC